MLKTLSIKNYALIESLDIDFNQGFSIITGETGAGKSILLGGLSLILGKRADLNTLKNKTQKCIIEAVFNVSRYELKSLFNAEDVDYEDETIIRREILPSGKSRAFVNDSPVNLSSLQTLGNQLIDIHSQHQTLELTQNNFQFNVVDSLAQNRNLLLDYANKLNVYKDTKKELETLLQTKNEAVKEYDYNSFLLQELTNANLVAGEQETLETEFETLNNIETIEVALSHSNQLLNSQDFGLLEQLRTLKQNFQNLSNYSKQYNDLFTRIESNYIELDDINNDITLLFEALDNNPKRLQEVNEKLQTIYNLQKKHNALTVSELITIKETLSQKVTLSENIDQLINQKEKTVEKTNSELNEIAQNITKSRQQAIPQLTQQLEAILKDLGLPNARFNIALKSSQEFLINGKDNLQFLFTANKGAQFLELKKAASGGELSRIMLAVKLILSKHTQLPTIIFDEIDTGVSGKIANKMAQIMATMSATMQVLTITHLPQIAAKGNTHYKVYKEDKNNQTQTNLQVLNDDDRIVEIAQMLGGINISDSAITHAKELLN